MRPLLLAAAVSLVASACAGGKPGPGSDDPAQLYRSKCTACHRAYERRSRGAGEWAAVLDRMAPRARLTPEERDRLRAWLVAGASDATPGGKP